MGATVHHRPFTCFICQATAYRGNLVQIQYGPLKLAIIKTCRKNECAAAATNGELGVMMRSKRKDTFENMETHAWLRNAYKKLSKAERILCLEFITENDSMNRQDFEQAVNRMFLDKPKKTKHWKEISELLSCCNSI